MVLGIFSADALILPVLHFGFVWQTGRPPRWVAGMEDSVHQLESMGIV